MTSVCNGRGNTIWRFADASAPDAGGFQTIAVEPAVVAARVAGISRGFVIMDDVGSEYERQGDKFTYHLFPNRFAASRESGVGTAPYFTIELGEYDLQPPPAPTGIKQLDTPGGPGVPGISEQLPPGQAKISWDVPLDIGPAGTIGFDVRVSPDAQWNWDRATPVPRYLIPMAGKQSSVVMHLRDMDLIPGADYRIGVRAIDAAGNVGPVAVGTFNASRSPAALALAEPTVQPFADAGELPALAGVSVSVADLLDKVHPITGELIPRHPAGYRTANHLWSAQQKLVRLYAGRNEFVGFQVVMQGKVEGLTATLTFDAPTGDPPGAGASPMAQPKGELSALPPRAYSSRPSARSSAAVDRQVFHPRDR